MKLPASAARLASSHPASRLSPGPVASGAILMPEHFDLRPHSGRRLFKRQREVVAQISSALPAPRPSALTASAAKHIRHAKKIAKNVLKVLEDRGVEAAVRAARLHARVPITVIHRPLLRIRKNAIRLRGLTELIFRLVLRVRIAIRMPFHRRLAISRLDLIGGSIALDAQRLVIIAFVMCRHYFF